MRNISKSNGVVLSPGDCLGQVLAYFGGVHVESSHKPNVADVVPAQCGVHEPGNHLIDRSVPVELDSLHQGRSTVAHPDDRNPYFFHCEILFMFD